MFGPKKVPKGVLSARPPAKGTAPSFSSVWQPTQPPAFARYSPRFASPCAIAPSGAASSATARRRRVMVADYALEKESPAAAGLSMVRLFLLLLLAEVLVAAAAGLADRADRRLLRRLVAAAAHLHEVLDRPLEVLLGLLELGRFAPDRRQRRGLYRRVLARRGEAVPGHAGERVEERGVHRHGVGVIGNLALGHAGHRPEVLALQRHRRLALLHQDLGFDLGHRSLREARAQREGQTGKKKPLVHSILLVRVVRGYANGIVIRRMAAITVRRGRLFQLDHGLLLLALDRLHQVLA